jgi:hydrogenase-1 operon protein HyaF
VVRVNRVPAPACAVQAPTALAGAVLREIAGLLDALVRNPRCEGAIDLRSLPMDDADRRALRAALGNGEVDARCEAAGVSRVQETALAGVWWVVHCAVDGTAMVEQIVVARAPELLLAHPADIAAAHLALLARIDKPVPTTRGADPL